MKRDFTRLLSLTRHEGDFLLRRAAEMKKMVREGVEHKPLRDKCLAMIFEKASTRTRISFEVGMRQLGGYSIFLNPSDTQIGRGEPVQDTARVLSRYADAIMIRTFSQETVEGLAAWSSVPVINGLSDVYHPCQILSDLLTAVEFKKDLTGLRFAYIGDGNNVANSWVEAAILFRISVVMATPEGYRPLPDLVEEAERGGRFRLTTDPAEAARGADVISTDVWISMGQEEETAARRKAFAGYQVNDGLLRKAAPGAIVMHCLPAYRDQEISGEVLERFQEVIFTQAENRLHGQKALLEWLMAGQ